MDVYRMWHFMELQKIKLTAAIDPQVCNRGIPLDNPTENGKFTHEAHALHHFVTKNKPIFNCM